jgi:hypothetical protein
VVARPRCKDGAPEMAASKVQESDGLEPGELTVRTNLINGMVEIAISDAGFELVLTRQAALDLIAKLTGATSRLDLEGGRARVLTAIRASRGEVGAVGCAAEPGSQRVPVGGRE